MTKVAFITTCTARKRSGASEIISIRNVSASTQESVSASWRKMISNSTSTVPVTNLYSGRSFFEMKKLSKSFQADLYIISAGLGLIDSTTRAPSYDLTVSGNGPSSISSKITSGNFCHHSWWREINDGKGAPISSLISSSKDTVFIIALSAPYFQLIRDDLKQLRPDHLSKLRIVGIKQAPNSIIESSILPYDDRLNGPDSPIPGTLSDYPQRCAVHFMNNIYQQSSLDSDRDVVAKSMELLTWPIRTTGKKLSDADLLCLLSKKIAETGMPKTKLLAHLRHTLKIACEQKRFAMLYDQAKKGIING